MMIQGRSLPVTRRDLKMMLKIPPMTKMMIVQTEEEDHILGMNNIVKITIGMDGIILSIINMVVLISILHLHSTHLHGIVEVIGEEEVEAIELGTTPTPHPKLMIPIMESMDHHQDHLGDHQLLL